MIFVVVEKGGNSVTNDFSGLIKQLDTLESIKKLFRIQQKQAELGGGFYGVIPDPIENPEQIPIPDTPDKFLDLLSYLSQIRDEQRKIVAGTGFPVDFLGRNYVPKDVKSSGRIKIILDLHAVREV
jgi:hypothetical protein